MMRFTLGFFFGANTITSAMTLSCMIDKPGDQDEHPCTGQPVVLRLPTGGAACCSTFGRISVGVEFSPTGQIEFSCTCSGPPSDGDLDTFRQQALQRHNQLRAQHGSPALTLSDELNNYAQKWAEQLAETKSLRHSERNLPNGEAVGENLASYTSFDAIDGGEPVQDWYNEIRYFDYNNPEPNIDLGSAPQTGHFTQVVWKSSSELGIGRARTDDGKTLYVVGTYRAPGNLRGSYEINVPGRL